MLARKLEISRISLITISKNKEKRIKDFEAGCSSKTKQKRKHNFKAVDEPLVKWFCQARDKKISVSGEMLLLKTQKYAEVCGCENPEKLNTSWINQWKMRKDIACKKLHGEAESIDQNGVDEWQTNCLPALSKQFKAENIFNADETGLFYQCLPERTHVFKNDMLCQWKTFKGKINCVSDSKHGWGKVDPCYCKNQLIQDVSKKKMPLPYELNKKVWMTAAIFEMWVKKLDSQM